VSKSRFVYMIGSCASCFGLEKVILSKGVYAYIASV